MFNNGWDTVGDGPKVSEAQLVVSAAALLVSMAFTVGWIMEGTGSPVVRRLGVVALILSVVALLMRVERRR